MFYKQKKCYLDIALVVTSMLGTLYSQQPNCPSYFKSEGQDSWSRLGLKPNAPRLSVSTRSCSYFDWDSRSQTRLFVFLSTSLGLVLSQNIGTLEILFRSRNILVSVSRVKARDSQSRPGLLQHLIIKKSWSQTCSLVNFHEVSFSVLS